MVTLVESSGLSEYWSPSEDVRLPLCTISLAAIGWTPCGNVDAVTYRHGALGILDGRTEP
jgi:hypothetical protein